MSRRRRQADPLRKSKREGIIEPDAPPIFQTIPTLAWQEEVAPTELPEPDEDRGADDD